MKILRSILAAFAAIAMLVGGFSSTPAFADKGKPSERVWMSGSVLSAITTELLTGSEVCVGSKRNHACSRINPFTGEALIQDVSRPMGANKNLVVNTIVTLTPAGVVVIDQRTGTVLSRFSVGSENANWQATLQSAFPAAVGGLTNGLGAAVVQAVANPCGGNCGGGGATAISISDSAAQSIANTIVQGAAGCAGPCAPASTPTHPRD